MLRRELTLLRDEGVDVVQIDDPHLCLLVDDSVRAGYADADEEAAFSAEMTNAVVEGIEGVGWPFTFAAGLVHACAEAMHTGGYGPIIRYLNALKVHHLTMEFTAPEQV